MKYFSFLFVMGLISWGSLSYYANPVSPANGVAQQRDLSSRMPNSDSVSLENLSEQDYVWTATEAQEYETYLSEAESAAVQDYKLALRKKSLKQLPSLVKRQGEVENVQSITEIKPLTEDEKKAFEEAITPELTGSESCLPKEGDSRNYLEASIGNIDGLILYARKKDDTAASVTLTDKYYQGQTVGKSCVTFVMKKFFEPAMKDPKRLFAYCPQASGVPELDLAAQDAMREETKKLESDLVIFDKKYPKPSGTKVDEREDLVKKINQLKADVEWRHKYYKTPCVSTDYVNATYNAFHDVTECLNISQKELLPKFFNESGLHVNAYGAGRDAGVGQLTGPAIQVSKGVLKKYVEGMKASKKASCERILSIVSSFEEVEHSPRQRCNLMAVPENPLRNLLYSGIFYKENVKMITGIFYADGEDRVRLNTGEVVDLEYSSKDQFGGQLGRKEAQAKLVSLGLTNVNMHEIKNMLVALAYNAGPQTVVNKFVDYLDERLAAKQKAKTKEEKNKWNLTTDHFDFLKYDVRPVRSQITPVSIKSSLIENERSETPDVALLADLKKLRDKEKLRRIELPKNYSEAKKLSLPEFLTIRTNSGPQPESSTKRAFELFGFPGYLSALASKNAILNLYFPNNECTNPNYLKLSK